MRKLAKKILAVCLSAVMAGTMLSAVAFATTAEAVSDDGYGITTLASAIVINEDQTETDWTVSGNVYIQKDVTLTLEGTTTISGNVYVFGTLRNNGALTITGTLHCLHYNSSLSAGSNYDYGYFINSGSAKINVLDVTSRWLDTEIPDTTDDGDDNNGDDDDDDDDSGTEIPSNIHVTVIDGEETFTEREITGDVVIPKDTTLTTTENVSINGDVYVLGTLINTGTLDITGTLYCLHYGSMLSAGDYDFGYVYNYSELHGHEMIVNGSYLSIDFPTSTVHTWDSGEVITEATCTEPGEVLYVCSGCGETKTETIPAGHTWDENIEWTWSEDHTSATATRTCSVCGETETVEASVTKEVTVEPTETKDGEIQYTATATFDDGTSITNSVTDTYSLEEKEKDEAANGGTDSTGTTGTGSTGTGTTGTGSTGSNGTGSTGTGSSGSSGNSGSSGTGSTVTSPQTSDSTNITALWMIVLCFGLSGCAALVIYKAHRNKE